jgi:cell division protein FtsB
MDELLVILQRKLIQLECYLSVSNRLLVEDLSVDTGILDEILTERDKQIAEYKHTEEQLEKQIKSLPDELIIRLALAGDSESIERFPQIAECAAKISAAIAEINRVDKAARVRITAERDNILALIENSEKGNRVANYMRQTNFDTTIGSSFNFKS